MARDRAGAIAVDGLSDFLRAMRRAGSDASKEMRHALREIADDVREHAAENVTHKTGRHGNDGPALADTLKVSVRQTGVSVYTEAPHGYVQDRGGRVGRDHATLLKRGEVSAYMTHAVQSEQARIEPRLDSIFTQLARDFAG